MKTIETLIKIFIAGVLAVIILSAFSLVYSYSGIHVTNKTGATDYVWRPYTLKSTMTEGIVWQIMDENGFHNESSDISNIDILLMGSSQIEAVMIKNSDTVAGQLNKIFSNMYTYSIGISGHVLNRQVDNIAKAIETYKPSTYVVLEADSVDLDIESMREVIEGRATPIPSYDTGLIYKLQLIPAFRPLYKQLDDWKNAGGGLKVFASGENTKTDEEYSKVLSRFLELIVNVCDGKNIQPIIVYHPGESLSDEGELVLNTDPEKLEMFSGCCEQLGIGFVDLSEKFLQSYRENYKLAYGFTNTEVGKGHLNEEGHRIMAKEIGEYISNRGKR